MKNYLIADRYTTALDRAVEREDELIATVEALDALAETYTTQEDLRSTLSNPALQLDARSAVLADVAKQLNAPESVVRLLDILLRRGRIALLPDIATLFSHRADTRLNRIGADVTTAAPLSDAQREILQRALEGYSGGTVSIHAQDDEKLLGGAVAKIGSVLIDGSVRSSLRRMRQAVMTDER